MSAYFWLPTLSTMTTPVAADVLLTWGYIALLSERFVPIAEHRQDWVRS